MRDKKVNKTQTKKKMPTWLIVVITVIATTLVCYGLLMLRRYLLFM